MADYVKQFDIGEGENAQNYIIKDAEARDTIEQLQGESEDLEKQINNLDSNKAPVNHASTATTYGQGNASNFGHVKLSDKYASSDGAASAGVGASDKALYDAYTELNNEDATLNNLIEQANTLIAQLQSAVTAAEGNISSLESDKAPVNHASTATTYGQGDASNFGHVKLSDKYTSSDGAASAGVGASDQALYDAYTELNGNKAYDFINGVGTLIPDGTDLNDLTTPGKYYKPSVDVGTLENCPTTSSITLYVLAHYNSSYKYQILFGSQSNGVLMYVRFLSSAKGGWSQLVPCTPNTSVGSSSTPIYLNNGVPTACGDIGSWPLITFTQSSDSAISSVNLQGRYNSALKIGYVDCNVTIASSVSSGWHTIATMNINPLIASTIIIPAGGGSAFGNFQISTSGTIEINVGTDAGGAGFRYAIMFPYG